MSADAVGLWAGFLDRMPASAAVSTALELEAAGVGTIWLQEFSGVDPFVRAALYLSATSSLRVALGVAVIYGRDAEAMTAVAWALEDAFPGRFTLGLGVSHRPMVEARGHSYGPAVATMRSYLTAMDAVKGKRRLPRRVLGALGPQMTTLAGEAADGAHAYFTPVAHTSRARGLLGADAWLAPSLMVALDEVAARRYLGMCLGMVNYTQNLARYGFTEDDFAGPSDRLVDALVVPDDALSIRRRIDEHGAAGADHVVLQFVPPATADVVVEVVKRRWPEL